MKQKWLSLRYKLKFKKVNEKNSEKFERKFPELERQHSRFQRKLDQRRREKWKNVKEERNIKVMRKSKTRKNNILESTGTNSSSLITQSKLVNKTRNETIND